MIKSDRLIRKLQVTDGLKLLNRLFSLLSTLFCTSEKIDERLIAFKGGMKKIIKDYLASMDFHKTKDDVAFTPVAMLNVTIHLVRYMRVSSNVLFILYNYSFTLYDILQISE